MKLVAIRKINPKIFACNYCIFEIAFLSLRVIHGKVTVKSSQVKQNDQIT